MKILKKIIPNATMVLSLSIIVLLICDICNPFLGFIDSKYTKYLLWIFCALNFTLSTMFLYLNVWRSQDKKK